MTKARKASGRAKSRPEIPDKTVIELWVRAGGRCEYEACNVPLWRDDLTMAQMNRAYVAHIISDSPAGPRGDRVLSPKLAVEFSNLMLLCDTHHRLIDKTDVAGHPADRLHSMKQVHEERIERVTGIHPSKKTEILLYGANIGSHSSPISYQKAVEAIVPDRYPASTSGIALGMTNSALRDHDSNFWQVEAVNLRRLFTEQVKPRLSDRSIQHLSIFAIAPQPLLMLLGYLVSDIASAEVYQLHKEPPDWRWQEDPVGGLFSVREPVNNGRVPALVLSLSATITDDRIVSVVGENAAIWRMASPKPNNDFLKSRLQLQEFRQTIRPLLDKIKTVHGQKTPLHVFPAVPVSVAIEFGRIIMPKADMPLRLYDQNNDRGGFIHALDIGAQQGDGQ